MGSLDPKLSDVRPENEFRPLDVEEFRKQAHQMVDFIAEYYKNIESYPVLSNVKPGYLRAVLPESAPYAPEPMNDIMQDVMTHIIPGMTHWLSPNFFAYFPATVSSAAFVGEMLSTAFNSVGFNWIASPAATELEMTVMDWLARMLKLPESFMFCNSGGGVIQNTTSESILVTLIAARDRFLSLHGSESSCKFVAYGSDQTHSTFNKACKILGLSNVRNIPTTIQNGFALSSLDLKRVMKSDIEAGLIPFYLCVTIGTTSTTAVDPLYELAKEALKYRVWVHVDAAYGGSACICPEFRDYLKGVEMIESLSFSPHKWLLSYLDCCCLWVKQPNLLTKALNTNPEYLKNHQSEFDGVVDYKDWQVGTGRKFKSIRLWLVLRNYGVLNLQAHIRSDVKMAKMFETFVRTDTRFEIVVPRRFALVCFRLKSPVNDGATMEYSGGIEYLNKKLLDWINSTGKMYMTHTKVGGVYMLRFAVGATLTEDRHIIEAWKLIKEGADRCYDDMVDVVSNGGGENGVVNLSFKI